MVRGLKEQKAQAAAAALRTRYAGLDGVELVRPILRDEFRGSVAVMSSFGAESAVLLDMVAEAAPATPVIFLDTGKLFEETYSYVGALSRFLGLTNIKILQPDTHTLARHDPDGDLWSRAPEHCCHIRKVAPLERLLEEGTYQAWLSGRKRYHGGLRVELETIEAVDGLIKVNPLAPWSEERIGARFKERGLPQHPLALQGYLSIGCHHCTRKPVAGEGVRSGRWSGSGRTECGIHRARWARPGGDAARSGTAS